MRLHLAICLGFLNHPFVVTHPSFERIEVVVVALLQLRIQALQCSLDRCFRFGKVVGVGLGLLNQFSV